MKLFFNPVDSKLLIMPLLTACLAVSGCSSDNDDSAMAVSDADTVMMDDDGTDTDMSESDGDSSSDTDSDGSSDNDGATDTDSDGVTDTDSDGTTDTDSDGTTDTDSDGTADTDSDGAAGTDSDSTTDNDSDGASDTDASNGSGNANTAIISTVASDYSSGAIAVFDTASPYNGQTQLNPRGSDIVVRAFADSYFLLARFQADNITRYKTSDPATAVFQVSTNDGGDEASSNPHDMVFVNENKAYLLRYGSPIVWIVNPSATDASQFKTGELDLTAYDVDGVPEATRGVVVDGRLFIIMQRLDAFAPTKPGYVAVFDTTTDREIDTGTGGSLPGIELPVFNPGDVVVDPATSDLIIAAQGDYGAFDGSRPPVFTGGIATVSTSDYSTGLLVDDTEETGRILSVEVANSGKGYMVTSAGFGDSSLVSFDPNTGATQQTGIAGLAGVDIRDIAMGPSGNVWVGVADATNPRVVVINSDDDSVVTDQIDTVLDPNNIVFAD